MNAFTHNRHGLVRVPWRLLTFILITIGIALVLTLAVSPLIISQMGGVEKIAEGEVDVSFGGISPYFVTLQNVLIIIAVLVASFVLARFFDKRPFASIGLGLHGKWIRELSIGLLMGAAFISIIVFIQLLAGCVRLNWSGFSGPVLLQECLPYALLFITVGFQEELLFRGYLLQSLAEGIGKVWATVIMSIPFGILHFFNEGGTAVGAIATGVAGILLCIAYFRTRSLWLPIGIHITWNFTMSWIFGLPVSGEQLPDPLLQGTVGDPIWLSGGQFGPEGSVLCFIGIGAMILMIVRSRAFAPCPRTVEWYPSPEERAGRAKEAPETEATDPVST